MITKKDYITDNGLEHLSVEEQELLYQEYLDDIFGGNNDIVSEDSWPYEPPRKPVIGNNYVDLPF